MAYLETSDKGQGTRIIDALSLVYSSAKAPPPSIMDIPIF